jgi:hypothetical protein
LGGLIRELASLQKLAPADDLDRALARLEPALRRYHELEFRSDGRRIDLITMTDDAQLADAFFELLTDRGQPPDELATVRALRRFGPCSPGSEVGLKLPVAGDVHGAEVYVGRCYPLAEVCYFLQRRGAGPEALAQVQAIGRIFDKRYAHILAADASATPRFPVFFTTYLEVDREEQDRERVRQALLATQVPDAAIDRFLELHGLLGGSRPKTLYFSFAVTNGQPAVGAKIDYAEVRLGLLSETMDAIGAAAEAHLPVEWGNRLAMPKASYAGVVVGPTGPIAARAYFSRD